MRAKNEDLIVLIKQGGAYIQEHAEDLVGKVAGEDILTSEITLTITASNGMLATITTNKTNLLPITIPFGNDSWNEVSK